MNALVPAGEKALAREAGMGERQQFLTFTLGGEMFAIEILNIKEIIEYGSLTTVPMMPEFVRGVINLRGRVVPVIDLSVRFGRKATEITNRTCNVIIEVQSEGETIDIGIVVDAVSEVLEIASSDIEPAPSFGAKIRADFISGMGKVNGEFVIILGLDKALSVEEMAILASAETNAASVG
ncbi:MAG: chemotaxis protein CheW [Thiohalomonadaceae bacterium]